VSLRLWFGVDIWVVAVWVWVWLLWALDSYLDVSLLPKNSVFVWAGILICLRVM
jgi:hypothetical protein